MKTTIEKRKAYVRERLHERSKFPKEKHNPRRGWYFRHEYRHVAQDWEDSAVLVLWDRLEAAGLVRLVWKPDEHTPTGDLLDHDFEARGYYRTAGGEREYRAQDRAQREKLDLDGAWGLEGEYRLEPCDRCSPWNTEACDHAGWQPGDGVWGFIGQEALGYELGIQAATIEALSRDLRARRRATQP